MFKYLRYFIFVFCLAFQTTSFGITLISWNIRDFGKSRDDNEIQAIAKVIAHGDIVAIQEVVAKDPGGAQAVARLVDQLNRMGAKWDYSISDPTNSRSSNISERYAFLWKTSKLSVTGGGPRLLCELSTSVEREPYFIQLKYKDIVIDIINYHACTHTSNFPERDEITTISSWLLKNKSNNILFAGDMNLEIDDIAFNTLRRYGYRNVLNGESTSLKKKCNNGEYLCRSEDNVLFNLRDFNLNSFKVIDFIQKEYCNDVEWKWVSYSDHLPVEVKLINK